MATLWHLTSLSRLESILSTMTLKPSQKETGNYSDKTKHISLTRSHNAYSGYEKFYQNVANVAIIALDGDMLQAKRKPFDYIGAIPMYQQGGRYRNGRDMYQKEYVNRGRDWDVYSQTEERLYTNKPVSIRGAFQGVEIVLNWVDCGLAGTIQKLEDEGPEGASRELMYIDMNAETALNTLMEIPVHPNNIKIYDTWDDYNTKTYMTYDTLIQCLRYVNRLRRE